MPHPRCSTTLVAALVTGLIVIPLSEASAQTASKSSTRNVITVTGCIRNADDYVVGTSGSTGGAERASRTPNDSSTKFILTESTQSSSSSETVGTSGTTSTGYRLDGDADKLLPHVGRKVEISGTIANPGSTSVVSESVLSGAPRLKVASVRPVASTCSP